ncbi:MAG: trigger factor [Actinobacteria bacterium]|nr:trigger factor [Actinomycetota bacterium]
MERMAVKTTVTEQETSAARLDVEVPAEDVTQSLDATLAGLAKEVRLPGFRKGKVPREIILQRFGMETVVAQMLEDKLPEWSEAAIDESGVEAVDILEPAQFETGPERGRSFSFNLKVQLLPKPELGRYRGIEAPREEVVVTDAEVDYQMNRLREELASLRPITGRPVEKGHFVTLDFKGTLDGTVIDGLSADDYVLEVGSGRILPELEEGILGMTAEEEKEVPAQFPEDWQDENTAGKTVLFTAKVKEIKEKVLPPLNDELAKDVSEFATLLELKVDIRRKLQSSKEAAARSRFRAAAVQSAVDNATVDVPDVMVARQLESMMQDYLRSLEMRGVDVQTFINENQDNLQALMAESRPQAEGLVKTGLVLDAVAAIEKLEASEEDIGGVVEPLASAAKTEPTVMREQLERSGRIQAIRQNLLRDKAANLIEEFAVAVEPDVSEGVAEDAPVDAGSAETPVADS